MNKTAWSRPTTNESAAARAGGRRRYNAQRQAEAGKRRRIVFHLYRAGVSPAVIADLVGVHPSTIYRDLRAWRVKLRH